MSQLAIKQKDWESPFFPMMRSDNLVYAVDLFPIFARSPVVEAQLQRCQFCKSFPFLVSEQPEPTQVKECELCQGLNEHEMRHYLIDRGDQPEELSNSYIMKSTSSTPKIVNLIIFIERLDRQYVSSLTAALKTIVQSQSIQASVVIPYHGSLALVDFLEQPELVVLSQDLCMRQAIEQCKYVLTVQMIEQLENILMIMSSEKSRGIIGYDLLRQTLIDYQAKIMNEVEIMVWIGKLPFEIKRLPRVYIKIIAILLVDRIIQKNSLLFDIGNQFAKVHYLYGDEASTQLYYELHKILSQEYLGFIIEGVAVLKTDKKYSGSVLNPPRNIINSTSAATIVTTNQMIPHKLQFNIEFTNFKGEHLRFISNLYESGKRRSIEWRERVVLISNALIHVLQAYYNIKTNPQKPNKSNEDISPSYIMNQLVNFGQKYENNTKTYSQLLKHMINYFKEFRKQAVKQYLPFSLIFRKELLFLFYPLWQGGILHHYDSMWVSNEVEEHVDWCNDFIGVSYTPRESTVPIFYSLCIDNGTYSFVQQ